MITLKNYFNKMKNPPVTFYKPFVITINNIDYKISGLKPIINKSIEDTVITLTQGEL